MARGRRAQSLVRSLLELVALVAVAGGAGVLIGMALAQLSDDEPTALAPADGTAAPARTATATVSARTTTTPTTPTATTTSTPTPLTTARRPPAQVQLRVLGAILHTAATPSGRRRQRARLIMRVRAQNSGENSVTLDDPILRVGSVRIRLDRAANPPETQLGTIAAGDTKSVTLRYELSGDATPKVTRDRRARLDIGGQSLSLRVRVGAPVRPSKAITAP